jgi:hypothetical protein
MSRLRRPLSVLALTLLLAGLTAPAAAFGQASPFTPLPQAAPDTPPVATTPSSSSTGSDDLGTTGEILLFGGGVLALTVIVWFIWRDARRRAPLTANEVPYDEDSLKTPHQKKRQARAKGKQAKQARRRNRSK